MARVGLGLFIVWQLLYLPLANLLNAEKELQQGLKLARENNHWVWRLLGQAPEARRQLWEWAKPPGDDSPPGKLTRGLRSAKTAVDWWAGITGQPQSWALFAPDVWQLVNFSAVEFFWDDPARPPMVFPSDNQPADLTFFVKRGRFRLRRLESALDLALVTGENEQLLGHLERWKELISNHVRDNHQLILAYLAWRLDEFRRRHPELPTPVSVVLRSRTWAIGDPHGPDAWKWKVVSDVPIARWQPGQEPPEGLPVEAYDPATREFQVLP